MRKRLLLGGLSRKVRHGRRMRLPPSPVLVQTTLPLWVPRPMLNVPARHEGCVDVRFLQGAVRVRHTEYAAVPSADAEASRLPSGLKQTLVTDPAW